MEKETLQVTFDNHTLTFETGEIGRQANGAVLLTQGDTTVFSSCCMEKEAQPELDFVPIRVDTSCKFFAAGRTSAGYIKRERPTQQEILQSRLTDRSLRPLFPKTLRQETQILSYVWSYDPTHPPDVLAMCSASAALAISDIPLARPIAGVRVGLIDGNYVINPSRTQMQESSLELILAGTEQGLLMIEGQADFLSEQQVLDAITFGHLRICTICQAIAQWAEKIGTPKDTTYTQTPENPALSLVASQRTAIREALFAPSKHARSEALHKVQATLLEECAIDGITPGQIKSALNKEQSALLRSSILEEKKRVDGRALDTVRPITIDLSKLPRAHGSALFTRGETQSMAVCTLGNNAMAQRFETLDGEDADRFYLQYSFPPFSVGEVGRVGSPGRREIGHGKLAEKALLPILPALDAFPYTLRLESIITESSGSSSMASVCGGCLAMMDAGVPIKKPVAGIAMGLILEDDQFEILSDISGIEDALGDMDFKIAGDGHAITTFQMDIKVEGITHAIMAKAIAQANRGIQSILSVMQEHCAAPRTELSPYAPRLETIKIPHDKIALVIGPGGKVIKGMIETFGVEIDITEDKKNGYVSITATDATRMEKAKAHVQALVADIEIGATYNGTIKSIVPFGLFIEILPGKEGLCHISEISQSRIENLNALFNEGDTLVVKVLDIDEKNKIKLSHKATLPPPC